MLSDDTQQPTRPAEGQGLGGPWQRGSRLSVEDLGPAHMADQDDGSPKNVVGVGVFVMIAATVLLATAVRDFFPTDEAYQLRSSLKAASHPGLRVIAFGGMFLLGLRLVVLGRRWRRSAVQQDHAAGERHSGPRGSAVPPSGWQSPLTSEREAVLARKLAESLRLSVAERSELTGGRMRGSAFVAAVGQILIETGQFPSDRRLDRPFDGMVIEARDHGLLLHERHEIGVMRYSDLESRPADSLESAVRSFVECTYGDDIDGIVLDWDQ